MLKMLETFKIVWNANAYSTLSALRVVFLLSPIHFIAIFFSF